MSHVVREAPHQHVNRGAPFLHKHGSSNGGGLQMFHARSELAVLCLIRGESREGQEELKKRKVTKLHSPVDWLCSQRGTMPPQTGNSQLDPQEDELDNGHRSASEEQLSQGFDTD